MDRRAFIKLTAVTGTTATLASCGNPEHQLIRFVPDEDLVPGIAEWKPSACPVCAAGCGVTVRVMEGEAEVIRDKQLGVMRMNLAKKLEGNPAHPVNQGGLCARGQAAIQLTYHPDRLANPLKRTGARGAGQFQAITWDEALTELIGHLDTVAAADPKALAFVTRRTMSGRRDLVAQFMEKFGAAPPVSFDLFGEDVLRRANMLSFGREQLPTFDLARSRYAIVFGADFLGTWGSPVSQAAAYGQMRQGRPGIRGKFVQVEPRMSPTGACADEWVPTRPGTEGVLALGLANVIMSAKLRPANAGRAGALIDGWSGGLTAYTPADVEKLTGVDARRIERLAREMAEAQPAVAIIGGAPLAQTNGLFQALAVNALNELLGSVGSPGGLLFTPQIESGATPGASRSLSALAADINGAAQSPVQMLLVDEANPVFAAPRAWKVGEAFGKVPYIASFSSFLNETTALADLILPDHSFLESWVDNRPESGAAMAVATVAAPVMRPLHDTRAMPDVLLDVSRRLKRPLNLPWMTFEDMLHASIGALVAPAAADEAWATARKQGGWWGEPANIPKAPAKPAARDAAKPTALQAVAQFDGDASQFPFYFLPYASTAFLDGSVAHLPWLQELPDPMTSAMWSTWVEINPQTAANLQIAQGDIVEVASSAGTLRAPALVSPGIAPDVLGMPVGQGHGSFTRYASGRGANPLGILAASAEPETGSLAWAATRVKISRVGPADGSLILFAGGIHEEPDLRR